MKQGHAGGWRHLPFVMPLAALVACALLLMMPAARVSAHSAYDHSAPAEGEVLTASPAQVHVFFKAEMTRANGLPTLDVVSEEGDLVSSNAALNDDDRTEVTADLNPSLEDGRYTVIWHNVSADDGDEAQGAFYFYVGEGPSSTATAAPTAPASPTATSVPTATAAPVKSNDDSGEIPVWGLIVGIIGGLVVGGAGGLVLGRRG